ncbi:MAG: phosphatase PAP2 family protein [Arachidicoccus sp.]|nr:phosphatase PAP2 family protein [Arachidicoccus sp.]
MLFPFLEKFDKKLFLQINKHWTNNFLDALMPWWRDQNTWVPLYLFLLVFMIVNSKHKTWMWLLFAIITILISDQLNSNLIKDFFHRLRPCNDPVMRYIEILRIPSRPSSPSFPSSHAVNHFAIAVYFFRTLKKYIGKWAWLFIVWAASICYAQVYVGVHYPFDVLGGAVLGSFIGFVTSFIYLKFFENKDVLFSHKINVPE